MRIVIDAYLVTDNGKRLNYYTRGLEASSQWYMRSFRNHVNCRFAKFLDKKKNQEHSK